MGVAAMGLTWTLNGHGGYLLGTKITGPESDDDSKTERSFASLSPFIFFMTLNYTQRPISRSVTFNLLNLLC
jgi:hypothetical protein